MTDREQVIAELQYIKRDVLEDSDKDKTLDKAIALLKEQDNCENCAIAIEDRQPIVRCKDCKYCEYPQAEKEWCKKGHLHRNAETWFCADGERR